MSEQYRPLLHMTPNSGWMNDPNGLVFFNGDYHQFLSVLPERHGLGGPMHWGGTKPVRISLTGKNMSQLCCPISLACAFSGSAIVDWHNTSGLFLKRVNQAYWRSIRRSFNLK
ncbi:hypothetical protein QW180_23210 [Vibrio sinaloensis]|nr:hypothetical protein [Vibrio sinaloensis]